MAVRAQVRVARPISAAADSRVWPSRYQVGLLVVLGAIFIIALAPKLDTDLWWHLKDGAFIAAHGSPPTHDYLSFTFAGRPWTDHEWLSDLFLYTCYRVAGLWGPIVAFAAIITAAFGLVYARMARTGANRIMCLFVLSGAFIASSSTWGARPQMLTLLFLAVFCLTLDRWVATGDRRLLAVFPVSMLLWANLHGGWVLGLVVMVLTLAGEWMNRVTRHEDALERRQLRDLTITIGLTLAATLLNPAGLREVLYPLVWIFPTAYSNVLTEWVSSDFHQPVTMVFEAMLLLLMGSVFVARPRVNWTHLLTVLAFTHLALSQSRNVAVWSIVVAPLVAVYLQQALSSRAVPGSTAPIRRTGGALKPRTERVINLAMLTLAALLYIIEAVHFISPASLRASERSTYPVDAMTYMQTHRLPPRTFAQYAWGGYVLWKGYPRYRDFIDGRANTLFDAAILRDYMAASTAAPGWQNVLNRRRVENVLIPPDLPLAQVLAQDRHWKRVYHDGTAVLYTRS